MNGRWRRHALAVTVVSLVILTAALISPGHALMLALGLAIGPFLRRFVADEKSPRENAEAAKAGGAISVETALNALPQPVVLVGSRGNVVLANTAALSAYPGLAVDQPLAFALRAPQVIDAVNATLADRTVRSIEIIEKVPVERAFTATVTVLDDTRPQLAALILRETSKERAVEAMRADFVANASHELRTPLASIIGFVETLRGAAKDDATAREQFLAITLAQAKRMARLIDDLLSLSRIELKEHIAPSDPVDLGTIARDVVFALSEVARDCGVELALTNTASSTIVPGDADELASVVENLVENAIKYGKSGKKVEVILEDGPADQLQLVVRDFGTGIPAQALPRLTERFYRVDNALSRAEGGTGLGLALVKHTLNRHRGRLSIDSTLGQGTTVTASLRRMAQLQPVINP